MSYLGKPHNRIQDNQVQLYTSIRDLNFYLLVGCKTIHISNTVEKLLWTNCIVTSLYRKNPHVRIQNNQVQLYIFFNTFVGNKKNPTHISNTIEQLLWTNCIATSWYARKPHIRIHDNQVQPYTGIRDLICYL